MCIKLHFEVRGIRGMEKKPMEYQKMIFNIPKQLLKDFDAFCYKNGYSRVEATKEAMRRIMKE